MSILLHERDRELNFKIDIHSLLSALEKMTLSTVRSTI